MVQYTFSLITQDDQQRYEFSYELNESQENSPDQLLQSQDFREKLRTHLQNESLCYISDAHLSKMLNRWREDIKEGFRKSSLELDLPLLVESNILQLQEDGFQDLPELHSPDLEGHEPIFGLSPPIDFL